MFRQSDAVSKVGVGQDEAQSNTGNINGFQNGHPCHCVFRLNFLV